MCFINTVDVFRMLVKGGKCVLKVGIFPRVALHTAMSWKSPAELCLPKSKIKPDFTSF